MRPEKIGFIGLGLIGGSIAKTIRRIHPDITLIAYDTNPETLSLALQEQVISTACTGLTEEFSSCRYIFLCAPVQKNLDFLETVAPLLGDGCILTDVGSVKASIHQQVAGTSLAPHFIGGHPMAGSEKNGYQNATPYLLENAYYIITPSPEADRALAEEFQDFTASLGAIPIMLDYQEHDFVTASISHLPHILASSLVNLVKDLDNSEGLMKRVAAGGFRDITRIASSSPVMWQQICLTNRTQILKLLDAFIASLEQTKGEIAASGEAYLFGFFQSAKDYRDSLPLTGSGPLPQVYELYCDMVDEAGGIAALATILATNQISIKNIGIIHNREFEDGVLHIEFYEESALSEAIALLRKYHYTVYER
ncbi:MAG: prephenate dehydrogenase [Lachnospiraceae bacterium]|jgi:prephenate dehydrogenase|nr:prephenate dehydrogenase [Lachnospiraceae bacterium]